MISRKWLFIITASGLLSSCSETPSSMADRALKTSEQAMSTSRNLDYEMRRLMLRVEELENSKRMSDARIADLESNLSNLLKTFNSNVDAVNGRNRTQDQQIDWLMNHTH